MDRDFLNNMKSRTLWKINKVPEENKLEYAINE